VDEWLKRLSAEAMIRRVLADAQVADPRRYGSLEMKKTLLKEMARNISSTAPPSPGPPGAPSVHLMWRAGILASPLRLAPGQRTEVSAGA
jgi:hypothetical protein